MYKNVYFSIKLLLVFSYFSFLVPDALAQEQAEKGEKVEVTETVSIRIFSKKPVEGFAKLALMQNDKKLASVDLVSGYVGEPLSLRRGELFLVKQDSEADKSDEEEVVLSISIPEKGKRFVLVLFEEAKGIQAKPYRNLLLPIDGETAFKGSDIFLHNTTEHQLVCHIGKEEFTVDPGESQVVTPVGDLAKGRLYTSRFTYKRKDGFKTFSSTRWPISKLGRAYIFFIPNQIQGKDPVFHSFVEFPPFP